MGMYAADGSWNVTVVSGSSITGLYAADGSINVVLAGGGWVGAYHPCGALNVTLNNDSGWQGRYAADGSLHVTNNDTLNGAQRVTAVSGSLVGAEGTPIGLLLILTVEI